MPMLLKLKDVEAAIGVAIARPEANFPVRGWSAAQLGRQARCAAAEGNIREVLSFLEMAAAAELEAAGGTGFQDALAIARTWIDQVTAQNGCAECGAEVGRNCTVNSAAGHPLQQKWVHGARISPVATVPPVVQA